MYYVLPCTVQYPRRVIKIDKLPTAGGLNRGITKGAANKLEDITQIRGQCCYGFRRMGQFNGLELCENELAKTPTRLSGKRNE